MWIVSKNPERIWGLRVSIKWFPPVQKPCFVSRCPLWLQDINKKKADEHLRCIDLKLWRGDGEERKHFPLQADGTVCVYLWLGERDRKHLPTRPQMCR